ncbi:helix-turn-helix domain-containing protein [Lactiplantibacillus daowaiensis]|uniref:Helix-turn-helix domain-containing protein n=1 Tax=Lactiplantibacillus daowaiensis TaxID=2559918 RepID=A0ABW1S0Y9_9LACO|nr:helix-turn-helix domain-containing protein [Lactiplantibacillus daowaiensis]
MSVFADRLKTAMQQAQLTSAQLSKQTGIGRSSISQWLSSKYVAKHDKVTILAQVLDVTPEWLLGAEQVTPANLVTAEPTVAPELMSIWDQLDAAGQAKLIKKGYKLLEKAPATPKKKKKKNKKKKSKKA